jgi:hypothetical protein
MLFFRLDKSLDSITSINQLYRTVQQALRLRRVIVRIHNDHRIRLLEPQTGQSQ